MPNLCFDVETDVKGAVIDFQGVLTSQYKRKINLTEVFIEILVKAKLLSKECSPFITENELNSASVSMDPKVSRVEIYDNQER